MSWYGTVSSPPLSMGVRRRWVRCWPSIPPNMQRIVNSLGGLNYSWTCEPWWILQQLGGPWTAMAGMEIGIWRVVWLRGIAFIRHVENPHIAHGCIESQWMYYPHLSSLGRIEEASAVAADPLPRFVDKAVDSALASDIGLHLLHVYRSPKRHRTSRNTTWWSTGIRGLLTYLFVLSTVKNVLNNCGGLFFF